MDFPLSSSPKHLVAMNRASTQGEAQFGVLSKAPLKLSVLQLGNSSKLGHPGGCSERPSLSINSESQAPASPAGGLGSRLSEWSARVTWTDGPVGARGGGPR